MLLSILLDSDLDFGYKILQLLLCVIAVLPAITFHEWAHGFAAYKLGDSTAKADGRLSLNPLDHLDPFGSLMLLLFGFGWAKPVPVNTRYFKKPKRDFAITSLAGPVANFVLALISGLLFVLMLFITGENNLMEYKTVEAITDIFFYSMVMNVGFGTFNLIPVPPLDGSNILMGILPQKAAVQYSKIRYYTRYIFLAILILTWLPEPLDVVGEWIFWPLNQLRLLFMRGITDLWQIALSPMFSGTAEYVVKIFLTLVYGI